MADRATVPHDHVLAQGQHGDLKRSNTGFLFGRNIARVFNFRSLLSHKAKAAAATTTTITTTISAAAATQ